MGFGSFEGLCAQSPLPLCSLVGQPTTLTSQHNPLILPTCTARSIELANTIIFEAATDFAHIGALAMTAIMVFHVRSKFTAVGRKEILTFFYIFMCLTVVSLVLDAGVLNATNTGAFPWFAAAQCGFVSALCTSLLINGFVGFQLYEDGTTLSIWLLRLTCLVTFVVSSAVGLFTFKGWAGLGPQNTTGLFVVLYVFNAIFIAVYVVMQFILVVNTLQDRWPLGDLIFGVLFFVGGQLFVYQFGTQICVGTSHYLDGLFFATICNLLGVMMVYKYWDSITKEDLEFSVGTKQGGWDVKQPFLGDTHDIHTANRASFYEGGLPNRSSAYDLDNPNRFSTYDSASLDYKPQTQDPRNRSRDMLLDVTAQNQSNMFSDEYYNEQDSYSDMRKSVNLQADPTNTYTYTDDSSDRENHNPNGQSRRRTSRHRQSGRRRSQQRRSNYDQY